MVKAILSHNVLNQQLNSFSEILGQSWTWS